MLFYRVFVLAALTVLIVAQRNGKPASISFFSQASVPSHRVQPPTRSSGKSSTGTPIKTYNKYAQTIGSRRLTSQLEPSETRLSRNVQSRSQNDRGAPNQQAYLRAQQEQNLQQRRRQQLLQQELNRRRQLQQRNVQQNQRNSLLSDRQYAASLQNKDETAGIQTREENNLQRQRQIILRLKQQQQQRLQQQQQQQQQQQRQLPERQQLESRSRVPPSEVRQNSQIRSQQKSSSPQSDYLQQRQLLQKIRQEQQQLQLLQLANLQRSSSRIDQKESESQGYRTKQPENRQEQQTHTSNKQFDQRNRVSDQQYHMQSPQQQQDQEQQPQIQLISQHRQQNDHLPLNDEQIQSQIYSTMPIQASPSTIPNKHSMYSDSIQIGLGTKPRVLYDPVATSTPQLNFESRRRTQSILDSKQSHGETVLRHNYPLKDDTESREGQQSQHQRQFQKTQLTASPHREISKLPSQQNEIYLRDISNLPPEILRQRLLLLNQKSRPTADSLVLQNTRASQTRNTNIILPEYETPVRTGRLEPTRSTGQEISKITNGQDISSHSYPLQSDIDKQIEANRINELRRLQELRRRNQEQDLHIQQQIDLLRQKQQQIKQQQQIQQQQLQQPTSEPQIPKQDVHHIQQQIDLLRQKQQLEQQQIKQQQQIQQQQQQQLQQPTTEPQIAKQQHNPSNQLQLQQQQNNKSPILNQQHGSNSSFFQQQQQQLLQQYWVEFLQLHNLHHPGQQFTNLQHQQKLALSPNLNTTGIQSVSVYSELNEAPLRINPSESVNLNLNAQNNTMDSPITDNSFPAQPSIVVLSPPHPTQSYPIVKTTKSTNTLHVERNTHFKTSQPILPQPTTAPPPVQTTTPVPTPPNIKVPEPEAPPPVPQYTPTIIRLFNTSIQIPEHIEKDPLMKSVFLEVIMKAKVEEELKKLQEQQAKAQLISHFATSVQLIQSTTTPLPSTTTIPTTTVSTTPEPPFYNTNITLNPAIFLTWSLPMFSIKKIKGSNISDIIDNLKQIQRQNIRHLGGNKVEYFRSFLLDKLIEDPRSIVIDDANTNYKQTYYERIDKGPSVLVKELISGLIGNVEPAGGLDFAGNIVKRQVNEHGEFTEAEDLLPALRFAWLLPTGSYPKNPSKIMDFILNKFGNKNVQKERDHGIRIIRHKSTVRNLPTPAPIIPNIDRNMNQANQQNIQNQNFNKQGTGDQNMMNHPQMSQIMQIVKLLYPNLPQDQLKQYIPLLLQQFQNTAQLHVTSSKNSSNSNHGNQNTNSINSLNNNNNYNNNINNHNNNNHNNNHGNQNTNSLNSVNNLNSNKYNNNNNHNNNHNTNNNNNNNIRQVPHQQQIAHNTQIHQTQQQPQNTGPVATDPQLSHAIETIRTLYPNLSQEEIKPHIEAMFQKFQRTQNSQNKNSTNSNNINNYSSNNNNMSPTSYSSNYGNNQNNIHTQKTNIPNPAQQQIQHNYQPQQSQQPKTTGPPVMHPLLSHAIETIKAQYPNIPQEQIQPLAQDMFQKFQAALSPLNVNHNHTNNSNSSGSINNIRQPNMAQPQNFQNQNMQPQNIQPPNTWSQILPQNIYSQNHQPQNINSQNVHSQNIQPEIGTQQDVQTQTFQSQNTHPQNAPPQNSQPQNMQTHHIHSQPQNMQTHHIHSQPPNMQTHHIHTQNMLPQNSQPQNMQMQHVYSQNKQPQNTQPHNMQTPHIHSQNMQPQYTQPHNMQTQHIHSQNMQPQHTQPQNSQPQSMQTQLTHSQHTQPQNSQPQNMQTQHINSQNMQPQNTQPQNTQPQNSQPQSMQTQYTYSQNTQSQNSQPQNLQTQHIHSQNMQPQNTQPQNSQPQSMQTQYEHSQNTQPQNTQQKVQTQHIHSQNMQPQNTQPQNSQPQSMQTQYEHSQNTQPQNTQQKMQAQHIHSQNMQPHNTQSQNMQNQHVNPQNVQQHNTHSQSMHSQNGQSSNINQQSTQSQYIEPKINQQHTQQHSYSPIHGQQQNVQSQNVMQQNVSPINIQHTIQPKSTHQNVQLQNMKRSVGPQVTYNTPNTTDNNTMDTNNLDTIYNPHHFSSSNIKPSSSSSPSQVSHLESRKALPSSSSSHPPTPFPSNVVYNQQDSHMSSTYSFPLETFAAGDLPTSTPSPPEQTQNDLPTTSPNLSILFPSLFDTISQPSNPAHTWDSFITKSNTNGLAETNNVTNKLDSTANENQIQQKQKQQQNSLEQWSNQHNQWPQNRPATDQQHPQQNSQTPKQEVVPTVLPPPQNVKQPQTAIPMPHVALKKDIASELGPDSLSINKSLPAEDYKSVSASPAIFQQGNYSNPLSNNLQHQNGNLIDSQNTNMNLQQQNLPQFQIDLNQPKGNFTSSQTLSEWLQNQQQILLPETSQQLPHSAKTTFLEPTLEPQIPLVQQSNLTPPPPYDRPQQQTEAEVSTVELEPNSQAASSYNRILNAKPGVHENSQNALSNYINSQIQTPKQNEIPNPTVPAIKNIIPNQSFHNQPTSFPSATLYSQSNRNGPSLTNIQNMNEDQKLRNQNFNVQDTSTHNQQIIQNIHTQPNVQNVPSLTSQSIPYFNNQPNVDQSTSNQKNIDVTRSHENVHSFQQNMNHVHIPSSMTNAGNYPSFSNQQNLNSIPSQRNIEQSSSFNDPKNIVVPGSNTNQNAHQTTHQNINQMHNVNNLNNLGHDPTFNSQQNLNSIPNFNSQQNIEQSTSFNDPKNTDAPNSHNNQNVHQTFQQSINQMQTFNNMKNLDLNPSFNNQQINNIPNFNDQSTGFNNQINPSFTNQINSNIIPSFNNQQNMDQSTMFSNQNNVNALSNQNIPNSHQTFQQNNNQIPTFNNIQNNDQNPSFSSKQQNANNIPNFINQQNVNQFPTFNNQNNIHSSSNHNNQNMDQTLHDNANQNAFGLHDNPHINPPTDIHKQHPINPTPSPISAVVNPFLTFLQQNPIIKYVTVPPPTTTTSKPLCPTHQSMKCKPKRVSARLVAFCKKRCDVTTGFCDSGLCTCSCMDEDNLVLSSQNSFQSFSTNSISPPVIKPQPRQFPPPNPYYAMPHGMFNQVPTPKPTLSTYGLLISMENPELTSPSPHSRRKMDID